MRVPKILMCQPLFYGVRYVINDWMNLENQPDTRKALLQWVELSKFYRFHGLNVEFMSPQPRLPDMVFTANAGLIHRGKFISSNFRHQERREESIYFRRHFAKKGFPVVYLPKDVFFEGYGDAVWLSAERLLLGYGQRTSEQAIPYLARYMPECEIIPLELKYSGRGKRFYHLDTVLAYFPATNTFLVYPDAFSDEALETIFRLGRVIPVTYEEAEQMSCNCVHIGHTPHLSHEIERIVIAPMGFSRRLCEILEDDGYRVLKIDTSEFLKSGGSVRCMSFMY